jgi:hypothetical protein
VVFDVAQYPPGDKDKTPDSKNRKCGEYAMCPKGFDDQKVALSAPHQNAEFRFAGDKKNIDFLYLKGYICCGCFFLKAFRWVSEVKFY